MPHRRMLGLLLGVVTAAGAIAPVAATAGAHARSASRSQTGREHSADTGQTTTPIKHLVVIFQENVSFDHYFGTYPNAANPSGEPRFTAARGTPSVNGLSVALLTNNPNGANPQRLDRSTPLTCDQGHGYTAEQKAFDMGAMDRFIPFTDNESCSPPDHT